RPSGVSVGRGRTLTAVELDAPRAFARWLGDHRAALGDVLEHGTWLDRDDVDSLLDLALPGVDELVGLLEIGRLARAGPTRRPGAAEQGSARHAEKAPAVATPYDLVVVDTAPTGHTLRLLAAPRTVAAVATLLDDLQAEHRVIRQQLARAGRPEAADRLIELLAAQAEELAQPLRASGRTPFHWVTLPEALSVAESEDGVRALDVFGIAINCIVVNRVTPGGDPCPICDRRRADERRIMADVRRRLARGRHLRVVSASGHEPRGVRALASVGRALLATPAPDRPARAALKTSAVRVAVSLS